MHFSQAACYAFTMATTLTCELLGQRHSSLRPEQFKLPQRLEDMPQGNPLSAQLKVSAESSYKIFDTNRKGGLSTALKFNKQSVTPDLLKTVSRSDVEKQTNNSESSTANDLAESLDNAWEYPKTLTLNFSLDLFSWCAWQNRQMTRMNLKFPQTLETCALDLTFSFLSSPGDM